MVGSSIQRGVVYTGQIRFNGRRKIASIAVFTALAISTNYLLLPLWNVKLMDMFVFMSGFMLGPAAGIAVAVLVWLVYGTLNPLGFSFFILFTVAPAEMLYGFVGGLVGRGRLVQIDDRKRKISLQMGILGLLLTFTYDIITNAVSGIVATQTLWPGILVGIITMNFPIPMGIIHEVANFLLFMFVAPSLTNILTKILSNDRSFSSTRFEGRVR